MILVQKTMLFGLTDQSEPLTENITPSPDAKKITMIKLSDNGSSFDFLAISINDTVITLFHMSQRTNILLIRCINNNAVGLLLSLYNAISARLLPAHYCWRMC